MKIVVGMVSVAMSLLLLVGCQTSSLEETQQAGVSQTTEETVVDSDFTEATTNEENEAIEEWSAINEVTPIESLQYEVVTDNRNNRVRLFENATGQKVVKSIYVKNTGRLKVIDLQADETLFNEEIK